MEERISFLSGDLRLEGLWRPGTGAGGCGCAVITHPHPLYGGDMRNSVVAAIADSFSAKGYATLRFNFRGTGRSEGGFDDGPGERRDLAAAMAWAQERSPGPVSVAGYSFGAWVAAGAAAEAPWNDTPLYLVSPPVAFISFANLSAPPSLAAVVAGSRDEFAPLPQVEALVERWQATATLAVIEGSDHFYSRHLTRLADALATRIPDISPGAALERPS